MDERQKRIAELHDRIAEATSAIAADLEERGECKVYFSADQLGNGGIAVFRRIGRKLGRQLGWKVRTYETKRDDDGGVLAVIMVTESDDEHKARWRAADFERMKAMWDKLEDEFIACKT